MRKSVQSVSGCDKHLFMKLTKRPMQKVIIFRAHPRDVDLLHAAAEQKEISQSDFIRQALREKAGRVLMGVDTSGREEERPE
jgi:predicted HicB family RNase H-like nuclease